MSDFDTRPTLNIRHPINVILPRNGQMIRLADGRRGWVAGHAFAAGKYTFIDADAGRTVDMWPVEFQGFKEIK